MRSTPILKAAASLAALSFATAMAGSALAQTPPTQTPPPEEEVMPADRGTDVTAPSVDASDAVAAQPAEQPSAAPPSDPMDPNMATQAPDTDMAPAAPATTVAAATAEPVQVTNGPVLDTAENRAKYPPQSRAGKRTPAKGN